MLMAAPTSSTPPVTTPTPPPRWTLVIQPTANMEATIEITAHGDNVFVGEVAHVVSKVVTRLTQTPNQRLPSEDEVKRQRAAEELVNTHPATRLLGKSGEQLWLGEQALQVLDGVLKSGGWIDVGAVPEGVRRACDYAKDEEQVRKLLGLGPVARPASPTVHLALVGTEEEGKVDVEGSVGSPSNSPPPVPSST